MLTQLLPPPPPPSASDRATSLSKALTYVVITVGVSMAIALIAAIFAPPPWDEIICPLTAVGVGVVLWKFLASVFRVAANGVAIPSQPAGSSPPVRDTETRPLDAIDWQQTRPLAALGWQATHPSLSRQVRIIGAAASPVSEAPAVAPSGRSPGREA